jgi:hypothetical protein
MKTLIALLLLTTTAIAQNVMSRTATLHDLKTWQPIGTATITGNRAYLHNLKHEHFATIEFGPNGKKTIYDPNGNVLEHMPNPQ